MITSLYFNVVSNITPALCDMPSALTMNPQAWSMDHSLLSCPTAATPDFTWYLTEAELDSVCYGQVSEDDREPHRLAFGLALYNETEGHSTTVLNEHRNPCMWRRDSVWS